MKDYCLSKDTLNQFWQLCMDLAQSGKRYRVTIVEWKDKRTLSMNALYWKWLGEIANQVEVGSDYYDADTWHHYFKKHWCPIKQIPLPVGQESVKSTAKLDKGEMSHYMSRIELWALDKMVELTNPDDSEYNKLKMEQEK